MTVPRLPCSAVAFADLAHRCGAVCRERGWAVPGFKTAPVDAPHNRSLHRAGSGGGVVSVKIRNREYGDVLEDLAAGVLVLNGQDRGPEAVYRLTLAVLDVPPEHPGLPLPDVDGEEEPF